MSNKTNVSEENQINSNVVQEYILNSDNYINECYLSDITIINPKTNDLPDFFNYIDLESVDSGVLKHKKLISKEEAPSRAKRFLSKNDILYQMVRPYQKNNLFFEFEDENYVASTGYAQIRVKNDVNSKFLYYLLHSDKFVNNVLVRCTGTSYPAINSNDLKKIKVNIPNKNTQDKIANFLTLIDKKISLMQKKHKNVEKIKNNILSNQINYIVNDAPKIKLKNLFEFKKGKGLSKEKIYSEGKYSAILYGELYTTYNEIIKEIISFTDYDEGVYSKKGDILIPASTTTKGLDLATASVVLEDNIQLGGDINILRKKKDLNPIYVATFLKYNMKKEILRLTQGSTIIHLYGKDLKKLSLNIPSLEIQNNIANLLNVLIKNEKLILSELWEMNTFKKGLLQKMFV